MTLPDSHHLASQQGESGPEYRVESPAAEYAESCDSQHTTTTGSTSPPARMQWGASGGLAPQMQQTQPTLFQEAAYAPPHAHKWS